MTPVAAHGSHREAPRRPPARPYPAKTPREPPSRRTTDGAATRPAPSVARPRSTLCAQSWNVPEADGSRGGNRVARFSTALGSVRESRAALRVAVAWGYVSAGDVGEGDALPPGCPVVSAHQDQGRRRV